MITELRETTPDTVVADLADALLGCVEWIEDVGGEAMAREDWAMVADARAAVTNARAVLARTRQAEAYVTLDQYLAAEIAAGRLRSEINPETGEVVYARMEGHA
jgi:hypothetical protein